MVCSLVAKICVVVVCGLLGGMIVASVAFWSYFVMRRESAVPMILTGELIFGLIVGVMSVRLTANIFQSSKAGAGIQIVVISILAALISLLINLVFFVPISNSLGEIRSYGSLVAGYGIVMAVISTCLWIWSHRTPLRSDSNNAVARIH